MWGCHWLKFVITLRNPKEPVLLAKNIYDKMLNLVQMTAPISDGKPGNWCLRSNASTRAMVRKRCPALESNPPAG